MLRSRLRIRTLNILIRPSLSWDLHPFSLPCPSPFLKTLVYHLAALISLAQAHTRHLVSLIFFSILSSFLWFHPQMRRHVHFPTDSSHHDCFSPRLKFSIKPEGQEAKCSSQTKITSSCPYKTPPLWKRDGLWTENDPMHGSDGISSLHNTVLCSESLLTALFVLKLALLTSNSKLFWKGTTKLGPGLILLFQSYIKLNAWLSERGNPAVLYIMHACISIIYPAKWMKPWTNVHYCHGSLQQWRK